LVNSGIEKLRQIAIGSFVDYVFSSTHWYTSHRISDRPVKTEINRMLVRPWFIGMLLLFSIHQVMQKVLGINILLLDSYLDPLLFMPILLHLMLWERRFLFGKGSCYILSWKRIICILVFVSVFCEFLFSYWSDSFTRDYWDIFCYAIGALLFGIYLNKPLKIKGVF
jgi:hypothetical protein